jgi:hypothetical protein
MTPRVTRRNLNATLAPGTRAANAVLAARAAEEVAIVE